MSIELRKIAISVAEYALREDPKVEKRDFLKYLVKAGDFDEALDFAVTIQEMDGFVTFLGLIHLNRARIVPFVEKLLQDGKIEAAERILKRSAEKNLIEIKKLKKLLKTTQFEKLKNGSDPETLLDFLENDPSINRTKKNCELWLSIWADAGNLPAIIRFKKILDKKDIRLSLNLIRVLLTFLDVELYKVMRPWNIAALHEDIALRLVHLGLTSKLTKLNCPLDGEVYVEAALEADVDTAIKLYPKIKDPRLKTAIAKKLQQAGRHQEAAEWVHGESQETLSEAILNVEDRKKAFELLKESDLVEPSVWLLVLKRIPQNLKTEACSVFAQRQIADFECWKVVMRYQKESPQFEVVKQALDIETTDTNFNRDRLEAMMKLKRNEWNERVFKLSKQCGKVPLKLRKLIISQFPTDQAWEFVDRAPSIDYPKLETEVINLIVRSEESHLTDRRLARVKEKFHSNLEGCLTALIRGGEVIALSFAVSLLSSSSSNPTKRAVIATINDESMLESVKPHARSGVLRKDWYSKKLQIAKEPTKEFVSLFLKICPERIEANQSRLAEIVRLRIDRDGREIYSSIKAFILNKPNTLKTFVHEVIKQLEGNYSENLYNLIKDDFDDLEELIEKDKTNYVLSMLTPWWKLKVPKEHQKMHFANCLRNIKDLDFRKEPSNPLYKAIIETRDKIMICTLIKLIIGENDVSLEEYKKALVLINQERDDLALSVTYAFLSWIHLEMDNPSISDRNLFEEMMRAYLQQNFQRARTHRNVSTFLAHNLSMMHLALEMGYFANKMEQIFIIIELMIPLYHANISEIQTFVEKTFPDTLQSERLNRIKTKLYG